ncbi:MAG: hypothetical protein ABJN26_01760 [Stappiaceae bacterium]
MRHNWRTVLIVISPLLAGCTANSPLTADGSFFGNLIPQEDSVPDTKRNKLLAPLLDSPVGKNMDLGDQNAAYKAQFAALEQNGPNIAVSWKNMRSENRGEVLPGPRYSINEAKCRDYTHKVVIGGEAESLRGVACMNSDGSWHSLI